MVLKGIRSQRDFVSWANVWLFFQVLFVINALMWSAQQGLKAEAGVVALVATWMFYQINKI